MIANTTDFPDFVARAPTILVHDALAEFLGATRDGIVEYRYEDAVRLAGHSCPTVACAFLMARAALGRLYRDELPRRGEIRVDCREAKDAGVTGVMAAVATLVTGAAEEGGFRGLAGRFGRRHLLRFGQAIGGDFRYARLDNGVAVAVSARLERVPGDPHMGELLPRCLAGEATHMEAEQFRRLWQDRVRRLLLEHADDPEVIVLQAQA